MANDEIKEEQPELTPEEIKQREDELIGFYNRQIQVVTPQLEYQRLATELEELKTRKVAAIVHRVQMSMPPPESSDPGDDDDQNQEQKPETSQAQPGEFNSEKSHRKLKTE